MALEGGEWSAARPSHTLPPRKDPVPIAQEARWASGPAWTGGKSRPTGVQSPDRPARSQSLYQLSYPAHMYVSVNTEIHPRRFQLYPAMAFSSSLVLCAYCSNVVFVSQNFKAEIISEISSSHNWSWWRFKRSGIQNIGISSPDYLAPSVIKLKSVRTLNNFVGADILTSTSSTVARATRSIRMA